MSRISGSERTETAADEEPSADTPSDRSRPLAAWQWLSGDSGKPRRSTIAAWVALLLVWLAVFVNVATWDFRHEPRSGDENNYIFQALSLAYDDHNLSYDTRDVDRWRDLDWSRTPNPQGIFFRTTDDGYAAAKPYGYSLYLAPFVPVFGAITGIAIANALLLTALLAVALAILRTRMSGPAVPLLAGAFVFGSFAYFYAFTTAVDLFYAVLTGVGCLAFLRAWTRRNAWWAALGVLATVFGLADRVTVGLVLIPAAVIVLVRLPGLRTRAALVGLGIVAYGVAVLPFLYYSDWQAISPYAPPRHYTSSARFDEPVEDFRERAAAQKPNPNKPPDHFSADGVWYRLTRDPIEIPKSAVYYVIGRHTGMLPFIPIALITFVLTLVLWRRVDAIGWAFFASLVGYALLYVVLYTSNYFGGGHSLGNRYFLQVAPLVLGLLATLKLSTRSAVMVAAVSCVASLVFLCPHHMHPEQAYLYLNRTTPLQRVLPFESNQRHQATFECPNGFGWQESPCSRESE